MPMVCCSGKSESLPPISWGSFNSSPETSVKTNQVRLPPFLLPRHLEESITFLPRQSNPETTVVGREVSLRGALVQRKGGLSFMKLRIYVLLLCRLCLSLQSCQDPCVLAQTMPRLSSDPKYSSGSDIVLIVFLLQLRPPEHPTLKDAVNFAKLMVICEIRMTRWWEVSNNQGYTLSQCLYRLKEIFGIFFLNILFKQAERQSLITVSLVQVQRTCREWLNYARFTAG